INNLNQGYTTFLIGRDNLVVRVKNGLTSSKYKPVDYEELYAITEAKKLQSANILLKIKKLQHASRMNKEHMLLKRHRQVWWKEHKRLHENRIALEKDMWQMERTTFVPELPPQLLELECPYPDLKASVLTEFYKLADDYSLKIQEADQDLKTIASSFQWSKEDLWKYQIVIGQYPSDMQGRRMLYLDMLQKLLPHKSRQSLIAHEKSWDHYYFSRNQLRVLMFNWIQARKTFIVKAVMTLAEACTAYETETMVANNRRKQQEICANLKEKVLLWRAQQEEAARLEAAIAARRKEEEDEKEKFAKEKELLQRAEDKEKVKKYWAEKQRKWQEREAKDLLRLAECKKLMAEQIIKDKERVQFRQKLLEKRLLEKKEAILKEVEEEEGRKKRLDALRKQVAIVAEFDPARMVADTVASKARMGIGTEEEFILQKPLFVLHTFNDEQIMSDTRVRVELALRDAGLHSTAYAQELLPKIPPPKLPRKDTVSTIFKI
uniref:Coiled-coil domain containing 148 n=1 Tax=Pseudonaja textilis TaxID=8673 RepID=A0A670YTS3_PSETE